MGSVKDVEEGVGVRRNGGIKREVKAKVEEEKVRRVKKKSRNKRISNIRPQRERRIYIREIIIR